VKVTTIITTAAIAVALDCGVCHWIAGCVTAKGKINIGSQTSL